jgi:hypothetical protein
VTTADPMQAINQLRQELIDAFTAATWTDSSRTSIRMS